MKLQLSLHYENLCCIFCFELKMAQKAGYSKHEKKRKENVRELSLMYHVKTDTDRCTSIVQLMTHSEYFITLLQLQTILKTSAFVNVSREER